MASISDDDNNTEVLMSTYNLNNTTVTSLSNNKKTIKDNGFVLDSGASEYYTSHKDWLLDYEIVSNKSIIIADSTRVPIQGKGNIPIIINNNKLIIKGVYYIPSLKTTLISSKELTNKGWEITFKDNLAKLVHRTSKLNTLAYWTYNAYYLDILVNYEAIEPLAYKVDTIISKGSLLDLYHKRFNHLSSDYLIKTIKSTTGLEEASEKAISSCEAC